MKKHILIALLMLCNIVVYADAEVKKYIVAGTVKDVNEEPVAYAQVAVVGTNVTISTGVGGTFNLKLNSGSYRLRVSHQNYKTKTLEIDVTENLNLDITLDMSENDLSEVVVTSTQSEKMLKDVPVITRVITAEQIKRVDPQDFKSLLEYELPGLQFGRAHGSGLPAMSFQGMYGRYLLFLIDGERIAGEGASETIDFNRIGIDNIERIEIVKGAMSTLYGSNALSGVVNIITKKANRPFVGNVSARLSRFWDQKYSLSLGTRLRKFSALTSAVYSKHNPYVIRDREEATLTFKLPDGRDSIVKVKDSVKVRGYENMSIEQKIGYDFTQRLSTELKVNGYFNRIRDFLDIGEKEKHTDRFWGIAFNGKVRYIFDDNNILEASVNHDRFYKEDYYPITKRIQRNYDNIQNNIKLNYKLFFLDRHYLNIGAEAYAESLLHHHFKDTTSHDVQNYVLFAQDDYQITDRLSIIGGVRMDIHSRYGMHLSPKLSAMYKLGNLAFRGGYAGGFRSPSLKELYTEWNHQDMFMLLGNPNLKPETSNQLSVSAEYTVGSLNTSVSGYYTQYRNLIVNTSISKGPGQYPDQTYKNADGISKVFGADVNMQVRLPFNITLRGAYSYVNDDATIDGRRYSMIRPHTVVLGANYNRKFGKFLIMGGLNGRWLSGISYWSNVVVGGKKSLVMSYFEPQMIWKLNMGCLFPRGIRLNVGIDNLFNNISKNVSNDPYSALSRGMELIANLSINIAELVGI